MSVLLSHIDGEARVGSVLREWIESSLDRDVDLRGELRDAEFGEQRLAEVDRVFGEAAVVLLLCSQRSIARPWISFESGCAWFKRVPVIALCHGGCSAAGLPPPLCSFPAFDLGDPASCRALLETLASHLRKKRVPRIDCEMMVAEIAAAMAPDAPPAPPAEDACDAPHVPESPAPAKPAPARRASDATKRSREISVLAAIEHRPDFTCTAPDLATVLDEQESIVREELEALVDDHLLTLRVSTNLTDPETRYAFTEKGKIYLATHGQ